MSSSTDQREICSSLISYLKDFLSPKEVKVSSISQEKSKFRNVKCFLAFGLHLGNQQPSISTEIISATYVQYNLQQSEL